MLVRRKELLVNDCSGRSGETALLAACYAPNPNIAEEIVRALLTRKDIDVNYPVDNNTYLFQQKNECLTI